MTDSELPSSDTNANQRADEHSTVIRIRALEKSGARLEGKVDVIERDRSFARGALWVIGVSMGLITIGVMWLVGTTVDTSAGQREIRVEMREISRSVDRLVEEQARRRPAP